MHDEPQPRASAHKRARRVDLVRVLLRRIRWRVTHQRLQSDEVQAALAQEAIGEAVSKLVRRQPPNARAPADPPDHSPQCLVACRPLRILPASLAVVCRHPVLDLDREHVVVELGLPARGSLSAARQRRRDRAAASISAGLFGARALGRGRGRGQPNGSRSLRSAGGPRPPSARLLGASVR